MTWPGTLEVQYVVDNRSFTGASLSTSTEVSRAFLAQVDAGLSFEVAVRARAPSRYRPCRQDLRQILESEEMPVIEGERQTEKFLGVLFFHSQIQVAQPIRHDVGIRWVVHSEFLQRRQCFLMLARSINARLLVRWGESTWRWLGWAAAAAGAALSSGSPSGLPLSIALVVLRDDGRLSRSPDQLDAGSEQPPPSATSSGSPRCLPGSPTCQTPHLRSTLLRSVEEADEGVEILSHSTAMSGTDLIIGAGRSLFLSSGRPPEWKPEGGGRTALAAGVRVAELAGALAAGFFGADRLGPDAGAAAARRSCSSTSVSGTRSR